MLPVKLEPEEGVGRFMVLQSFTTPSFKSNPGLSAPRKPKWQGRAQRGFSVACRQNPPKRGTLKKRHTHPPHGGGGGGTSLWLAEAAFCSSLAEGLEFGGLPLLKTVWWT